MGGKYFSDQSVRWVIRVVGLVAAAGCAACIFWARGTHGDLNSRLITLNVLNNTASEIDELRWQITTHQDQAVGDLTEDLGTLRTGLASLAAGGPPDQYTHQLMIRIDALLTQAQRALDNGSQPPPQRLSGSSVASEVNLHLGEAVRLTREAGDRQSALMETHMEGFKLSLGFGVVLASIAVVLFGLEVWLFVRNARSQGILRSNQSLHQLLAAAVRSTDEGVLISNTGGKFGEPTIVFANQSFKNMSGLTDQDLVGKPLNSLRESCLREKEFSLLEHTYSDSRSATMETIRWRENGSKVHCQWHISPVCNESGRVTHYISILSDTTRLREHEEAQRKSHEELVAVNQELVENQQQLIQSEKMAFLGQLAAGVAHEINNPLGYVMSNLEILSEDLQELLANADGQEPIAGRTAPVTETSHILEESINGLDRVADIVQRLKNFARPADENLVEANINHEIEESLKIVWNEIKNKCEVKKSLGELPALKCRPAQLNQVFTNLLLNAAQAIPQHGEISLQTEVVESNIVVRIADNGDGIPDEHLPSLFTPFFTTKPAGEGTGLGLSVSYGIVQKHHGTIEVESTPGRGSVFTVRLPIEPPVS